MPVRVVLFDLDDTLMEEEGPLVAAYRAACAPVEGRHGIPVNAFIAKARTLGREAFRTAPAIEYLRAIDAGSSDLLSADYDATAPHAAAMAEWLEWYRRGFFRNGLQAFGIDDAVLADDLLARFREHRHAHHRIYPETFEVLAPLAKRLPLVLVTNGPGPHQRRKVEVAGFTSYFRALAISGEVGVSKPDARMFTAALDASGVAPAEAIMVGNNLERDIGGAQAHGIPGVWINRNEESGMSIQPTWEIRDLRELLAIID